jgi:uncharacterized membrane protein YgcG
LLEVTLQEGNMAGKKLATLIIVLLVSIYGLGQSAGYPIKKGIVNDYAGKLDQTQINELAGLIKQYERKTSIEFAVVVVDSLHGQSAKDYARGIGDSWRVGKAGRNNGIVLLWAPNERAYSLRIADGLSADLSDSDATTIIRANLLPNFKRGEYYAGLKETVAATMAHLGDQTWEERLQARTRSAEQARIDQQRRAEEERQSEVRRQQEQAKQDEEDRKTLGQVMWFVFGFVVVAGTVALIWFMIHRSRLHKKELTELANASTAIAENLRTAENNAPKIQQLLNDFSKELPEQNIGPLSDDLAGQPGRILKLKLDATLLDFTKLESYEEMVRVRTGSETEAGLLESVQQRIANIRKAKEQSQALMEQLSKENFEISQVVDTSRRSQVDELLSRSRQGYQQARQSSSMSVVDWLVINELLSSSHTQVQQAVQYSQEAPYVPPVESTSSNSFSSTSSDSFGGGSSSSAGFGGGGGFSGGSGSDGSY